MKDEIIDEIRAVRREIMAEFDNDIHKYCEFLMREQEEKKKQGHVFHDFSNPLRAAGKAEPESLILREEPKK